MGVHVGILVKQHAVVTELQPGRWIVRVPFSDFVRTADSAEAVWTGWAAEYADYVRRDPEEQQRLTEFARSRKDW